MLQNSAELITNQLFDRLFPSIEKGENLIGEFEVFGIIRDAKKIPEKDESLSVQGLAWIVLGDIDKGAELCEQAIEINPTESAIWINYAVALGQRGFYAEQRSVLNRSTITLSPSLLLFDFIISSFWADYKEMSRIKDMFVSLDGIELNDKQKEDYMMAEAIYNTLDSLSEKERCSLSEMANIAMDVLSKHNIKTKNSGQYVAPDGMLSFNYDVFNVPVGTIIKLNDELANRIVEQGLYDAQSIVLFTPGV